MRYYASSILLTNNVTTSPDDESDDYIPPATYPRNFTIGQVVWGPTRGYPSWPGKLVHDSDVRGNYRMDKAEDGKVRDGALSIELYLKYSDMQTSIEIPL